MKTVVTHNGSFHADDVFAVATLQLVFGVDALTIVRTRDEALIDAADIVVDVGGQYNAASLRFDHHQPGAPVRENGIPYAAFGLVWQEYGQQVCGSPVIAAAIDTALVTPIDAGDSGVLIATPRFSGISEFDIFRTIRSFAPAWDSDASKDSAFLHAVTFARELLQRLIVRERGEVAMVAYVQQVYNDSNDATVLYFDRGVASSTCIQFPEVKLVVTPDENGNWTATAVRKSFDSFASRVQFPEPWAGLRDEALEKMSGIPDMVFCHKGRFFIVAKTKAAVMSAIQCVA
jgi:uncharacterized UPF0160 family protein